jgi:hypothetical protein
MMTYRNKDERIGELIEANNALVEKYRTLRARWRRGASEIYIHGLVMGVLAGAIGMGVMLMFIINWGAFYCAVPR